MRERVETQQTERREPHTGHKLAARVNRPPCLGSFRAFESDGKLAEHTEPPTEVPYGQKRHPPQAFPPPHVRQWLQQLQPKPPSLHRPSRAPQTTPSTGKSSLNAIEPGDKLIGAAGGSVTLDVGLGSAVHRVEHHEAVLGPPILRGEDRGTLHLGPQHSFPSEESGGPPPPSFL